MGRKLRLVNVEPKDKKGETYRVIIDAGYDLISWVVTDGIIRATNTPRMN